MGGHPRSVESAWLGVALIHRAPSIEAECLGMRKVASTRAAAARADIGMPDGS